MSLQDPHVPGRQSDVHVCRLPRGCRRCSCSQTYRTASREGSAVTVETAQLPASILSLNWHPFSACKASPQWTPLLAASTWLACLLQAVSPINARAKGIRNLTVKQKPSLSPRSTAKQAVLAPPSLARVSSKMYFIVFRKKFVLITRHGACHGVTCLYNFHS